MKYFNNDIIFKLNILNNQIFNDDIVSKIFFIKKIQIIIIEFLIYFSYLIFLYLILISKYIITLTYSIFTHILVNLY
jgi:hypothetical protein